MFVIPIYDSHVDLLVSRLIVAVMSQVPVQASAPAGGPPSAPVSAPHLSEKDQEIAELKATIKENDDLADKARLVMDDGTKSKDERTQARVEWTTCMDAAHDASDQLKVLNPAQVPAPPGKSIAGEAFHRSLPLACRTSSCLVPNSLSCLSR